MNAPAQRLPRASATGDVRQYLRTATASLHAGVDGAFPDGLRDAPTYARYLIGMHRFALDFETATGVVPRHSYWLSRDLAALSLAPLAPVGIQPTIQDGAERAGWDYVMAGSSVGARHLVRGVRALGHDGAHGARFLEEHGRSDDWTRIQARLAAFDLHNAPQLARVVRGARDAFISVAASFDRSVQTTPAPDKERP